MWEIIEDCLTKTFSFENLKEAIEFANKITEIAEKENHHPDLLIHSYKKVKVMLKTHSEKKITEKDYDLSKLIDQIV